MIFFFRCFQISNGQLENVGNVDSCWDVCESALLYTTPFQHCLNFCVVFALKEDPNIALTCKCC